MIPSSHVRFANAPSNGRTNGHDTSMMNSTKPLVLFAANATSANRNASSPSSASRSENSTEFTRAGTESKYPTCRSTICSSYAAERHVRVVHRGWRLARYDALSLHGHRLAARVARRRACFHYVLADVTIVHVIPAVRRHLRPPLPRFDPFRVRMASADPLTAHPAVVNTTLQQQERSAERRSLSICRPMSNDLSYPATYSLASATTGAAARPVSRRQARGMSPCCHVTRNMLATKTELYVPVDHADQQHQQEVADAVAAQQQQRQDREDQRQRRVERAPHRLQQAVVHRVREAPDLRRARRSRGCGRRRRSSRARRSRRPSASP